MANIVTMENSSKFKIIDFPLDIFNKNSLFIKAVVLTLIILVITGPTIVYEIFFVNAASVNTQSYANIPGYTEYGIQTDPDGSNPIFPSKEQLQVLNPTWIRYPVRGDCSTPKSKYTYVNQKILAIVNNQSCSHKVPPGNTNNLNIWKQYIDGTYLPSLEKFISSKPKVDAIELWNEEDISCKSNHYCPFVPHASYAYLVANAVTIINKAYSNEAKPKIILGGLGSGQTSYLKSLINDLESGQLKSNFPNTLSYINAIGIHPYNKSPKNGDLLNLLN